MSRKVIPFPARTALAALVPEHEAAKDLVLRFGPEGALLVAVAIPLHAMHALSRNPIPVLIAKTFIEGSGLIDGMRRTARLYLTDRKAFGLADREYCAALRAGVLCVENGCNRRATVQSPEGEPQCAEHAKACDPACADPYQPRVRGFDEEGPDGR